MAIVGFGFTRAEVERKHPLGGKINIRNNIAIKGVEAHEFTTSDAKMNKDRKGLKFSFEFLTAYGQDAKIKLEGEVFFIGTKKESDEVLKSYKKDQKVPKEVLPIILNYALSRANVQAIALSKDFGLPPPMPMPRFSAEKADNSYIG